MNFEQVSNFINACSHFLELIFFRVEALELGSLVLQY